MSRWYEQAGRDGDVVISTRIRLARNLRGYPFSDRMTDEQKRELAGKIKNLVLTDELSEYGFSFLEMENIGDMKALELTEKHIISPEFAAGRKGSYLLLSRDQSVSIMLFEEDHLRIQVLSCEFDLINSLKIANAIDDVFDRTLEYAFNEKLGYLTQCPTNLGTGLRASVMLHLPALEATGVMGKTINTIGKLGLTLRGTYGEGTKAKGAMYQLSNQVTLGISEQAAVENLTSIAMQLISQERTVRDRFRAEATEDKIFRSVGAIRYARMMSSEELLEHISFIRIGISLGLITDINLDTIAYILSKTGSATIMSEKNDSMSPKDRDIERAAIVRRILESGNRQ